MSQAAPAEQCAKQRSMSAGMNFYAKWIKMECFFIMFQVCLKRPSSPAITQQHLGQQVHTWQMTKTNSLLCFSSSHLANDVVTGWCYFLTVHSAIHPKKSLLDTFSNIILGNLAPSHLKMLSERGDMSFGY